MKNKITILLLIIIGFGLFLRVWNIDKYPAGFNADEAAYAYNAYSLIETGKDEFGVSWPIHLISFADYKPAGTTYLMIPFIKLFGLNEIAARMPSIIAGTISIGLIFLLVQELFGIYALSLISALFLAISPWHIHFSRGGWETNIATTFMMAGLYFFLKAINKKTVYLWVSVLFLSLAIYIYHAPRVVIPVLGLFIIYNYRDFLVKNLKSTLVAGLIGLTILLPFIITFFGPAVSARFSGVGVFSDAGPFGQVIQMRGEDKGLNPIISKVLHNRLVSYGIKIGENWLSHFDGTYLFVVGDRLGRNNPPDMGEMYLFDAIFVVAGICFLFKNRPKYGKIILAWLLAAPLASSLTFQAPTALRAHNMVIPLIIISAYGCYYLSLLIKDKFPKFILIIYYLSLIIGISWSTSYFIHQYFVHYDKTYPEAWEYGIRDLVTYLEPIKSNYEKVYVTEQYDQPYIIFLFYSKYPPATFQKEAILSARDNFGFSTVRDFDKYHFENINWENLRTKSNSLICGTDKEIPDDAKIIKTINYSNGTPAFQCAKTL